MPLAIIRPSLHKETIQEPNLQWEICRFTLKKSTAGIQKTIRGCHPPIWCAALDPMRDQIVGMNPKFIDAVKSGSVLVDFDARTGHNHGTKFHLRQGAYRDLYNSVREI